MGHQRLGKLPAYRLLPEIIRLLLDGQMPGPDLVKHVHQLGHDALKVAMRDPVFVQAVWLMMCLPHAAASAQPEGSIAALGVTIPGELSVAGLLAGVDAALEAVQRRCDGKATDLGEIARQSALAAMADAIGSTLPALWQPTAEDVRHAIAVRRSTEGSADLVQQFHARFVERVLQFYIDRDLHRMVGPEKVSKSFNDRRSFDAALRRHCDEASLIMRGFARDWLGARVYRDGRIPTHDDVRRFTSYSLEKMRHELSQRQGAS